MSKDKVAFSIVIPTCNRPELLARALQSVQEQSFTDYEVIIVNNGTLDIHKRKYSALKSNFDDRFKFVDFYNDEAQGFGPAIARNIGIQKASAEYLLFLDDDDIWIRKDYLDTLYTLIQKHTPDILLFEQSGVETSNGIENEIRPLWFPEIEDPAFFQRISCQIGTIDFSYFSTRGVFPHLNITVYKKDLIDHVGGFTRNLWYEEDLELFLRAADKADHIYFCNKKVAKHFIPVKNNHQNVSSSVDEINKHRIRVAIADLLFVNIQSTPVRKYVLGMKSSSAKSLSHLYGKKKDYKLEVMYASAGLAAKYSLKWHVYYEFLKLKRFFYRLFK